MPVFPSGTWKALGTSGFEKSLDVSSRGRVLTWDVGCIDTIAILEPPSPACQQLGYKEGAALILRRRNNVLILLSANE